MWTMYIFKDSMFKVTLIDNYVNLLLCHSQLSLIRVVFWNGVNPFCLLSWTEVWVDGFQPNTLSLPS